MAFTFSAQKYAEHRGCHTSLIRRWLSQGRLKGAAKKNRKGHWQIDPDRADAILSKSLDPGQLKKTPESAPGTGGIDAPNYHEERAKKEHWLAALRALEYRQKAGELLPAAEVKKAAFESGKAVRLAAMAVPERIAALLAAETDEFTIRAILSEELSQALLNALGSDSD